MTPKQESARDLFVAAIKLAAKGRCDDEMLRCVMANGKVWETAQHSSSPGLPEENNPAPDLVLPDKGKRLQGRHELPHPKTVLNAIMLYNRGVAIEEVRTNPNRPIKVFLWVCLLTDKERQRLLAAAKDSSATGKPFMARRKSMSVSYAEVKGYSTQELIDIVASRVSVDNPKVDETPQGKKDKARKSPRQSDLLPQPGGILSAISLYKRGLTLADFKRGNRPTDPGRNGPGRGIIAWVELLTDAERIELERLARKTQARGGQITLRQVKNFSVSYLEAKEMARENRS